MIQSTVLLRTKRNRMHNAESLLLFSRNEIPDDTLSNGKVNNLFLWVWVCCLTTVEKFIELCANEHATYALPFFYYLFLHKQITISMMLPFQWFSSRLAHSDKPQKCKAENSFFFLQKYLFVFHNWMRKRIAFAVQRCSELFIDDAMWYHRYHHRSVRP